jgi:tetratricopeptide (TPR) repeat protein
MKLDPNKLLKIVSAPLPEAEEHLNELLVSQDFDTSIASKLVIELYSRERYTLAVMVFKLWTEADPMNPEPWSNLGLCLSRCGDYVAGRDALLQALRVDPHFGTALNNLASVYQSLGDHDKQLQTAKKALSLQPGSALAINNLGSALFDKGKVKEAREAYQRSSALVPDFFEARFNLARLDSNDGNYDEAINFLEKSVEMPSKNIQQFRQMIEYQLSLDYLSTGRLNEGWQLYDNGFSIKIPPNIGRMPRRKFNVPMWDGRLLKKGERLMIWREQGVGDEIRFSALIPLLPESLKKSLIIESDPRLVRLLASSMQGVTVRGENETVSDFDYHIPMGSLPRFLMNASDALIHSPPLFQPSSAEVDEFASRLSGFKDKKLIGICWRSNVLSERRNKKYTELKDWKRILSIPDVIFINLQYGECEQEIRKIEQDLDIQVQRWTDLDLMDDFNGVAALIKNLDLVVSVSTAVVPLAGAVAVPTICMCHQNWVLLGEKSTYPWFRSVVPFIVPHSEPIASAIEPVYQLIMDSLDR